MVDPVGIKQGGPVSERRPVAVASVSRVEAPKPVAHQALAVESAAAQATVEMAARPPVDSERVARIKKAVQEGRFPIYPSTIADRLLALKMEWNPNDAA